MARICCAHALSLIEAETSKMCPKLMISLLAISLLDLVHYRHVQATEPMMHAGLHNRCNSSQISIFSRGV